MALSSSTLLQCSSLPRRSLLRATARSLYHRTIRNAATSSAVHEAQETHLDRRDYDAPQRDEFWRSVPTYANVPTSDFLSYRWSIHNTVQGKIKLWNFLNAVVPDEIPLDKCASKFQSKEDLLKDVFDGIDAAAMAIRITPYVLSRIKWQDPRHDPIFRQFLPLKSAMLPDHPKLTLDSLHETADSPAPGLVHRYPDKALFLATTVCPTYCTFCTRSYAVGANTDSVTKTSFKPTRRRWDAIFDYIEATPQLQDIVVSGGDSFYLEPEHIQYIGERLIGLPNIRRFRFASKGLAVAPIRFLDQSDSWASALANVSRQARRVGKAVALHTHFNHPHEISWITREAAQLLFEANVTVRNQTVLLKGVNDDVETMSRLIRQLADNNIEPYYVYVGDMVKTNEHLRTSLQTLLDIEAQITGSIAGFMAPKFIVDLPGGGGKRIGHGYKSYDRTTGVSSFEAPAIHKGGMSSKPEVFKYYDPIGSHTEKLNGSKVDDEHSGSR
ncbi:unnamed protein product [Discula destructiva]